MKKLLLLILISFSSVSFGQSSVNASGASITGSNGTVSYTIGQIDYTNYEGSNGSINLGVQQPYEIYDLGIDLIELAVSVFPNPTTNQITIQCEDCLKYNPTIYMIDSKGNLTFSSEMKTNEVELIMNQFQSGIYFINIQSENHILKSFKIIKR